MVDMDLPKVETVSFLWCFTVSEKVEDQDLFIFFLTINHVDHVTTGGKSIPLDTTRCTFPCQPALFSI